MNWSWIPQLHYDFIGRIVPGVTLIGASILVGVGPATAIHSLLGECPSERYFTFGAIVTTVLAGYLLGLLLSEVWQQTIGRVLKKHEDEVEKEEFKRHFDAHKKLMAHSGTPFSLGLEDLPKRCVMRTQLRHVVPSDVARLLKLRAERRLCQVLILGLAALSIANLWPLVRDPV